MTDPGRTVRRKERLLFALVLAVILIPVALLARRIDSNRQHVTFLRWIDDQAGIERGSWMDPNRTASEESLYREVGRHAQGLTPEFETLDIPAKWRVLKHKDMASTFSSFQQLLDEGEVRIQGMQIDFTTSEVSANVGALLLGFSKAVADLLWLQVNAAWENGLVDRMLPLMNTVVSLDPQFTEAYSLGAWHLAYNVSSVQVTQTQKSRTIHEAIDFVEGGLRKNPRTSQLYEDMGFSLYFRKLGDAEQAEAYLVQGIQFEPHEPRMERAAAIMMERQRHEAEALTLLQAYAVKHPDWVQHKIAIGRLEEKLRARSLEAAGDLEGALTLWESLDSHTMSEPVAPLEVVRLTALVEAAALEAAGDLTMARATLMRARSTLPGAYHDDIPERILALTPRIEEPDDSDA